MIGYNRLNRHYFLGYLERAGLTSIDSIDVDGTVLTIKHSGCRVPGDGRATVAGDRRH